MTDLLAVRNLTVAYGASPVLWDFELHLGVGETVALLGANGAGKSTALAAIAGIVAARSGELFYDGRRLDHRPDPGALADLGLVLVPEGRRIFRGLTVAQHVQLLSGDGPRSGWKRLTEWFPELEPLKGRRAGVLSGGEQQMLSIGCAMLRYPRVLMIDELSLGLAPLIVERVLLAVTRAAAEEGIALLLVEQYAHLALENTERAYVLRLGHTAFAGLSRDLAEHADLLRAAYLGNDPSPAIGEPNVIEIPEKEA